MGKAIRITEDQVTVSRRGRTASFDSDLLEDLESLEVGEALDLSPYFEDEVPTSDKEVKAKVGAEIRKHWKNVYGDKDDSLRMRLDWGAGVPQVRIKG
jgi:hypothetical protein